MHLTRVIKLTVQGCFTDFPFPDDTPSHCSAADVQRYLEAYVEHFDLAPRLRLGIVVTGVRRDDANDRWIVEVEGQGPRYFDKVVMAGGINSRPHVPQIEGIESFGGEVLHSRAFKE
jgi:dimethylaniline monooxygenase (N-oxide forming) / hypotaurine monooxygenase